MEHQGFRVTPDPSYRNSWSGTNVAAHFVITHTGLRCACNLVLSLPEVLFFDPKLRNHTALLNRYIHSSKSGGAGESRTPDTQFRKLLLYPSELQPHQ
jgi:hypothetical protein